MVFTTSLSGKNKEEDREENVNSLDMYGLTPLHWAMEQNQVSTVRILLVNPETRLDIASKAGSTPLHMACHENSHKVIPLYCQDLRCTPGLINRKNDAGETPLMVAVYKGNLACVQELVKVEGVNWHTTDNRGQSLLEVAKDEDCHNPQIVTILEEKQRGVEHTAHGSREEDFEEETPSMKVRQREEEHEGIKRGVKHTADIPREGVLEEAPIKRIRSEEEEQEGEPAVKSLTPENGEDQSLLKAYQEKITAELDKLDESDVQRRILKYRFIQKELDLLREVFAQQEKKLIARKNLNRWI